MKNLQLKYIGEMETLCQVMEELAVQGYIIDFNLRTDQLEGAENPLEEFPDNFLIDKSYRFEGESDPEDEAIIYAISSLDGTTKGVLIDGYGPSSQVEWEQTIIKLKRRNAWKPC